MTTCATAFTETQVTIGATIHADFWWGDAVLRPVYNHYAIMTITDPSGDVCANYIEFNDQTSPFTGHPLECVTDATGTWTCQISVWNGNWYIVCDDTINVIPAGATSCTADFQEHTPDVGDTIHADFTWENAQQDPSNLLYAIMYIKDPNGDTCDIYTEFANSSSSKTLSCVTDMAGDWTCTIEVYTGVTYVYCNSFTPVSQDYTLKKAITCDPFPGTNCGDEGPEKTIFNEFDSVRAYSEFEPYPPVPLPIRQEWWYKATGESDYTWRWQHLGDKYQCIWSTWDIGNSYGPGEGLIKTYLQGGLIAERYFTIPSVGNVTGEFNPFQARYGPVQAGQTSVRIADYAVKNTGNADGMIYVEIYQFPNTDWEEEIFNAAGVCQEGQTCPTSPTLIPANANVPSVATFQAIYPNNQNGPWNWTLCAVCRGKDENFPTCSVLSNTIKVYP